MNVYHVPNFKLPNIFNPTVGSISHSADGVQSKGANVAYNTEDVDGYLLFRIQRDQVADPTCIVSAGPNPEDATWSGATSVFMHQQCIPAPQHEAPDPLDGSSIPIDAESHNNTHPPSLSKAVSLTVSLTGFTPSSFNGTACQYHHSTYVTINQISK